MTEEEQEPLPDNAPPQGATDAVLKASDPVPVDSQPVQGIDFNKHADSPITVAGMVAGMATMGFQASAVAEAARVVDEMRTYSHPLTGEGSTIFLGYTSNLISSGLRETIRYLVQHRHVTAIVTTAGGVEEDLIKCLGKTYLGSFALSGSTLRQQGMNRIGNLIIPNDNYCHFQDWVVPIFDKIVAEREEMLAANAKKDDNDAFSSLYLTPSKLIHRLGLEINDESSVCYWAAKNDIPIYCPALTDGSLGDMLYFHSYKAQTPGRYLRLDIVEDLRRINKTAVRAPRVGMIVLGGGLVKHHIANACLMRDGADYAVYVNTGQEFDGSDAGARPDEAVSWGKIKAGAESVKVYADATIVFPMVVAATFANVGGAKTIPALRLSDDYYA